MDDQEGLHYIGFIEQCLIEESGGANDVARSKIDLILTQLIEVYGWHRYVMERVGVIRNISAKLYGAHQPGDISFGQLKLAALQECVSLRRYVMRLKW